MKGSEYADLILKTFIESLDEHGTDWQKGWMTTGSSGFLPVNGVTGAEYNGSNVFILMALGGGCGFESNQWATYKQWQSAGKQVLKGQKATGWVRRFVSGTYEDGEGEEQSYQTMKVSAVFNEEQLDGYERTEPSAKPNEVTQQAIADRFITSLNADVREGGDRAFYVPKADYINMPPQWKFKDTSDATATQNYYSTLMHEHVHWTGHSSRLDRDMGGSSFSQSYAFEELVAELGSVLLSLTLGLTRQPTPDHAKYINNWKKGLQDSPKLLLKAMAKAQQAIDWMEDHHAIDSNFPKIAAE
jgi:antirestriction protein ArdC